MAQTVLPRVQAMVLCDEVMESAQEPGVHNLSAVRTIIDVTSFPYLCPRLCVFLQMSGHRGEAACQIEIEKVGTNDLIHHTKAKLISFTEPVAVVPVLFRMRNCVFPSPGVYYV
jgi:hypothetical protein